MMKFLFVFMFIVLVQAQVHAQVEYRIVYGDQASEFKIESTSAGGQINFVNSAGRNDKFDVSKTNLKFLEEQAKKIKGNNNKNFCQRNYIELKINKRKVIGCLNSKTPVARALRENTNFLASYF